MSDLDSTAQHGPRPARRRRSAARMPAVIDPAEVPEDAAGRVELIAVRAPADVLDPADVVDPTEMPTERLRPERRLTPLVLTANGWIAVGVLGAILVIAFLIGLAFTH